MRRIGFFCVVLTLSASSSSALAGIVLPTPGPHPSPPWTWHHDAVVVGQGIALAPAPGPGNVAVVPFGDGLNVVAEPWHIEAEVVCTDVGGCGPGNLVVHIVGVGGWVRACGAMALGAKCQIAVGGAPHPEIVWPEVPEVGGWIATYTNGSPDTIDMDGGVSEIKHRSLAPDHGNVPTPQDFSGDTIPVTPLYLLRLQGGAYGACCMPNGDCVDSQTQTDCETAGGRFRSAGTTCAGIVSCAIPTMSEWGLVVMLLLVGAAGTVVITRRGAMAA